MQARHSSRSTTRRTRRLSAAALAVAVAGAVALSTCSDPAPETGGKDVAALPNGQRVEAPEVRVDDAPPTDRPDMPARGEATVDVAPPPVFPEPAHLSFARGGLALGPGSRIVAPGGDERLSWVARMLSKELGRALAVEAGELPIRDASRTDATASDIVLGTTTDGDAARARLGGLVSRLADVEGAYVLGVTPGGAAVLGRDAGGAYYGALTLLQLLDRTSDGKTRLACTEVIDHPYHRYRGMRATFPRGVPRAGEITHEYFKDFLRLLSLFKMNHVWVQGTSFSIPLRRHPETAWQNVLTLEQAKELDRYGTRLFLSMDGSLDWGYVYYKYKHLAELYPDETWKKPRKGMRKWSRVVVCPSNPETWTMLFETMEDLMEVLSGDHFAIPLDELYQEYHGSRWAVCERCAGKDPVKLYAEFVGRLMKHAIARGKTPIMSGGMLLREHQGWYKGLYKAVDLIEERDKIVIYNWSEGHIRRGAMKYRGERLQIPDFKTTPFFKAHGYRDVMHMFTGKWHGRPEMREVKGKLDCYGGFVSYYCAMDRETLKAKKVLASLAFTAQHLWSPDRPAMDSDDDARAQSYAEALADAVLQGSSYIEAIQRARAAVHPRDEAATGNAVERLFESGDSPVILFGASRGERTEGRMKIVLPVEEANPRAAHLHLTLHDWDQAGEGEIYVNGHRVTLAPSALSNGKDYAFPPVEVPAAWLKFGPEANVVRFVYHKTAGFVARKVAISVTDR